MKDNPCKGCKLHNQPILMNAHRENEIELDSEGDHHLIYNCVLYSQTITSITYKEFRDKYCPCVNCLVKAICPPSSRFQGGEKECDLMIKARDSITLIIAFKNLPAGYF